jgi:hypothetical protein
MVKLMASTAVDCDRFNTDVNFKCYQCEPRNGAPLFLADLNKDMRYPLPCANNDKPVGAKEVRVSGQLYYISDDKRIFTQSKNGEYEELLDTDLKEYVLSKL